MYRQLKWINHSSVDFCGTAAFHCVGCHLLGCVTPCTLAEIYRHWRQPFYVKRWVTRMIIERERSSEYSTKLHVITFQ